jgi:hypothetical protein
MFGNKKLDKAVKDEIAARVADAKADLEKYLSRRFEEVIADMNVHLAKLDDRSAATQDAQAEHHAKVEFWRTEDRNYYRDHAAKVEQYLEGFNSILKALLAPAAKKAKKK